MCTGLATVQILLDITMITPQIEILHPGQRWVECYQLPKTLLRTEYDFSKLEYQIEGIDVDAH